MSQQIKIYWNSDMGKSYGESVMALSNYNPPPSKVTTSLKIKGNIPWNVMEQLMAMRAELDWTVSVVVTGSWNEEDDGQLRLWGPPTVQQNELPSVYVKDEEDNDALDHVVEELENEQEEA